MMFRFEEERQDETFDFLCVEIPKVYNEETFSFYL